MLDAMRPFYALQSLLIALVMGLWAGGAVAQGEDDGGWFDEADREQRPLLKIHRTGGPYDPPPADFESDPLPAASSTPAEAADRVVTEGEDDPDAQRRALREFSPHLAPYGHWVDDPFYGRIWVPARSAIGVGFSPYVSAGHWELTPDDEWLWVSDYPFGWITFHYGRWVWTSGYDWAWVPGYRYSPAWVDFRIGSSGYVGWGPAAPYRAWRGGVFVSVGVRRPLPYIFCPTTYVFSHSLHRHVIHDRHRVRSIAAETYRYRPHRVSSWTRVARGPSAVEARIPSHAVPTRRAIARPRFVDARSSASGNNVMGSHLTTRDVRRRDVMSSGARRESRASGLSLESRSRASTNSRRDAALRANRQYQRVPTSDKGAFPTHQRTRVAPTALQPARPAQGRESVPAARSSRADARGTRGSSGYRSLQRPRSREIQGPAR